MDPLSSVYGITQLGPAAIPKWHASLEDVALSEWLVFRGRLSCPPVRMTSNLQTKTPEEIRMNWQAAGIYLIIN